MTFAKRLRIAALVPAIAGLILAGALFESHRALGGLEEKERTVYRIGVAFGELNFLAGAYMTHHAERPRQQFLLAHDEITGVLASLAAESPQYGPPLKELAETSDVTKRLFLKLVATYERHETVGNEALRKEAEERLGSRLLIHTRKAVNVASVLVDRISHDIVASQRRIYVLTSAFLAAAVIALGLVLHGLTRRLAGSLERVQKGIRMIGGGNLNHRIRLSSSDELGELANAFDRMSETLQATTVSRDELAVEVAERKKAEKALRAAKEGLQVRVAERTAELSALADRLQEELLRRRRTEHSLEEQSALLKSMLENLGEGVVVSDRDGRFLVFNSAAERLVRRGPTNTGPGEWTEHYGFFLPDTVTPWPPDRLPLVRAIRGESVSEVEMFVRHENLPDGAWIAATATPLTGPEGTVAGGIVVFRDITMGKRAAEVLAESEERFRTLVEDLPVGIFIAQGGRIVFQNSEQKRLFGPVPDGLDLAQFRDVHPEDADKFAQLCEAACSDEGAILELDLRFFPYGKSSEGFEMRWAHVRTSPIEHLGRKAVLVSMADISRIKELEHLVRVREKMASLGHVAAGIAHEIRNPLSGINIYVSAMEHLGDRSEALAPEDKEKIRNIIVQLKSASNKIATVVQRVMEFAKPDAPRLDRVDLNTAIEAAIQLSSVALRKKGIALSKALSPDLPLCLADLRLIEQVILNLINNAAQAMEGMEGARRIEISSGAEDGRILIRVADSGPGIPPLLREKIFDPFFTTRKEGYGIGLSFSHRVITDHGGSLTVGTSRWGGAEFRIELPVQAAMEAGSSGTAR